MSKRLFSKLKNARKAIEGFALAGGAAEAVIHTVQQGGNVDVSSIKHAVTVLLCALIGAGYKSLINWMKNKD